MIYLTDDARVHSDNYGLCIYACYLTRSSRRPRRVFPVKIPLQAEGYAEGDVFKAGLYSDLVMAGSRTAGRPCIRSSRQAKSIVTTNADDTIVLVVPTEKDDFMCYSQMFALNFQQVELFTGTNPKTGVSKKTEGAIACLRRPGDAVRLDDGRCFIMTDGPFVVETCDPYEVRRYVEEYAGHFIGLSYGGYDRDEWIKLSH